MKRLTALVTPLTLMALLLCPTAGALEPDHDTPHMRLYSVEGDFQLYREALEIAITGRGITLNNVAHIADMLSRTADAVEGEPVYRHAQALEFCSAVHSRRMMEADPRNIVYCPYVIVLYETVEEPGVIHMGYRRPAGGEDEASRERLERVETLLDGIVREALMF